MIKEKELFLIYQFAASQSPIYLKQANGVEIKSYYYILDFFSSTGEIDLQKLSYNFEKMYKRPLEKKEKIGPFFDLEELYSYALKMAKESHCPGVTILSVFDYNNALADVSNISFFKDQLKKSGKFIAINPHRPAKGIIFNRLFGH